MIPIRIHAALDGVSAAALLLGPRALGWPREVQGPLAAAGLGTAAYSLLTRYEEGSPKPLALKRHLALDAAQGAAFLAAAALLDREPRAVRLSMAGYGLFALGAALLTERREAAPFGAILETFVVSEILKLAGAGEERVGLSHYRDKEGREVDVLIEDRRGRVVGVEVKASATVRADDFGGLRRLAEACGDRFALGLVLHDHDRVTPFGDRLAAAPLSALWA